MHPIVVISGLSQQANERILRVEVRDEQGLHADSLTIELDDRDAILDLPERSQTLSVSIGYEEFGLVNKGIFKVDGVTASGPPFVIKIHAKSADMSSKLKEKRNKSWENKTIGNIVSDIAERNGLAPRISPSLANIQTDYVALSEESDMHFLTRLAGDYDASFQVKDNQLIFAERGELESVTGKTMTPVVVSGTRGGASGGFGDLPGELIDYRCDVLQRPRHSAGEKRGWDKNKADIYFERDVSLSGSSDANNRARYLDSGNKPDTKKKARGKSRKGKRGRGQLSLTIVGDPLVSTETPLTVINVRTGIDGVWRVKRATHEFSGAHAYTVKIEAEKPNEDKRAEGTGKAIRILSQGTAGSAAP
ncbi:MAG: phage late control D family protein [Bacteroidota bacterium]